MPSKNGRPPGKPAILIERDSIMGYLRQHSHGRQGRIAREVGVSRESLCRYVNGERELADVRVLGKLQQWMERDRGA